MGSSKPSPMSASRWDGGHHGTCQWKEVARDSLDRHFRGQSQDQRPQVANSPKRAEIINGVAVAGVL